LGFTDGGKSCSREFSIRHSTFIIFPGMIPRDILKKIRQICTRCIVHSKSAAFALLVATLAVAGCRSVQPKATNLTIITALNNEDWNTLQKLALPGSRGADYLQGWKTRPVKVGRLVRTEEAAWWDGKPCTKSYYHLENKDGSVNPHELVIFTRKHPNGRLELLDFGNFGW
jgi:hypothetical protein